MTKIHLRQAVALVVLAAFAAAAGASAAAGTGGAWTVGKAERTFEREGRFAVPASLRSELEGELERRITLFRALQQWAADEGDEDAWWAYHGYATRFQAALDTVESGMRVAEAACSGLGRAEGRSRFSRFTCLARSEALAIPSTRLSRPDGSSLPVVVEQQARLVGPYVTPVEIRVTSGARFAYE